LQYLVCTWDEVHKDYVYSDNWVDYLVEKLDDDIFYNKISDKKKKVDNPSTETEN